MVDVSSVAWALRITSSPYSHTNTYRQSTLRTRKFYMNWWVAVTCHTRLVGSDGRTILAPLRAEWQGIFRQPRRFIPCRASSPVCKKGGNLSYPIFVIFQAWAFRSHNTEVILTSANLDMVLVLTWMERKLSEDFTGVYRSVQYYCNKLPENRLATAKEWRWKQWN